MALLLGGCGWATAAILAATAGGGGSSGGGSGAESGDRTPPSMPNQNQATALSPYAALVSWTASTDDVTPSNQIVYDIYVNTASLQGAAGAPFATTDPGATRFIVGGLLPSTQVWFTVVAIDAAGNRGGPVSEQDAITFAAPTPTIGNAGSLATPRDTMAMVMLVNGRVVAAGGTASTGPSTASEEWDPATGNWNPSSGGLISARTDCPIVELDGGSALVAGGRNGGTFRNTAELYSPTTGTWSATGSFATARAFATATRLLDGRVLLAGGGSTAPLTTVDIYDPATGTWTATGAMNTARQQHAAALLADGRVLVCGGKFTTISDTNAAEIYNPATGTWSTIASLAGARSKHAAVRLPKGNVMVIGGTASFGLATCETYDIASNTWVARASLSNARFEHSTTLLPAGRVLVAGGRPSLAGSAMTSTEIFSIRANSWTAGPTLANARYLHSATLVPSGQVMITGGLNGTRVAATELIDTRAPTWRSMPTGLSSAVYAATGTVLPDGRALLAGGTNGTTTQTACLIFNPSTATWATTGSLGTARTQHQSVLLPDGRVLAVGGFNGSALSSCELYDPATGTWTVTGSLLTTRQSSFSVSLLRTGQVIVVGGDSASGRQASCELYDPVTATWTATGSMSGPRVSHSATIVNNGHLLVAGGANTTAHLSSAEEYNPATGTWNASGTMGNNRHSHVAALLPNGSVLASGGFATAPGGPGYRTACDRWTGSAWTADAALPTALANAFGTLMTDGQILLTGGETTGPSPTQTSQTYDVALFAWVARTPHISPGTQAMDLLLPNGEVLNAGGLNGGTPMNNVEMRNPGLGFATFAQPRIDSVNGSTAFPVTVRPTDNLSLTGLRLRGASEASGGSTGSSASDTPIVTLLGPVCGTFTQMGARMGRRWVLPPTGFASGTGMGGIVIPSAYDAVSNTNGIGPGFYYLHVTVNGIPSDGRIIRVQPDGGLNSGFATGGILAIDPSGGDDRLESMTSDGTSIYLAGNDQASGMQWRIEKRSLATGALDATFGGGTGVVVSNLGAGSHATRTIIHDGTNLYIGGFDETVAVANPQWRIEKRLMSTGALVGGFGTGGVVQTNPTSGSDTLRHMVSDGTNLYCVGFATTPNWRIEKRLMSTGALVTAFNTTGIINYATSGGVNSTPSGVLYDGTNIYIAGYYNPTGSVTDWRVEKRLASTGALVTGFGTNGVQLSAGAGTTDALNQAVHDGTNMYLCGSRGGTTWRIEKRSLATGALVTSFNSTGVVSTNPSAGSDNASAIALDSGFLYIGGHDSVPGNDRTRFVKRSAATGALVPTFGAGGVVTRNLSTGADQLFAILVDGNFVYAGGPDFGTGGGQWTVQKRTK